MSTGEMRTGSMQLQRDVLTVVSCALTSAFFLPHLVGFCKDVSVTCYRLWPFSVAMNENSCLFHLAKLNLCNPTLNISLTMWAKKKTVLRKRTSSGRAKSWCYRLRDGLELRNLCFGGEKLKNWFQVRLWD